MKQRAGLILGPAIAILTIALPPPTGMPIDAWRVVGLAGWMAAWWLSEAIALEATSLLPVLYMPLLGIASIADATSPYADPIIFLFLGGFLLAATMERWGLHRRFALATVSVSGTDGARVVLAFMAASAGLSMWISNTATAVMMLPIAKAVAGGVEQASTDELPPPSGFATALMLGVAYGCSIGGVATLIGTPPNAILAAVSAELLNISIGFGEWMVLGLTVAVPLFFLAWFVLIRLFKVSGEIPGLGGVIEQQRSLLGRLTAAERFIIGVFAMTALAWIFRAPKTIGTMRVPGLTDLLPNLSDTAIAIGAALLMFAVPLGRSRFPTALDWRTASRVPWGVLLLFGGGLSLAAAFAESGLTAWIGQQIQGLQGLPYPLVLVVTVSLFVLLTEITSNTATAALGIPLIHGAALGLGLSPFSLMAAIALATSMAFMMPVATPPNAIVFGTGQVPMRDMVRAGARLNIAAVVVVSATIYFMG